MARIKAVQQGTNAELIATAQVLYPMDGNVLDLTPGTKLGFWKNFKPAGLQLLEPGVDFRATGLDAGSRHHVIFDPPYVTKGGHKTSTIGEMNERYGMLHVEKNPMAQWHLQIIPGVREAHRLLAGDIGDGTEALLWLKCMDYVTSGKVWWFTKMAQQTLEGIGFDLVDEFILDGEPGPQPLTDKCKRCKGIGGYPVYRSGPDLDDWVYCEVCHGEKKVPRRQVHAARGHSVLIIARKRNERANRAFARRQAKLVEQYG